MTNSRRSALIGGSLAVAIAVTLVVARVRAADDAAEAERLFGLLSLQPGMTVGEIGAGSGGMTVEMAKRLGPEGRVYSTELNADRRADIRAAITRQHLANVTVVEAGDQSTNLPDACCDAIFMRSVYHHFTHPEEIDRSLAAALKPGGRLAIIDFEPTPGSSVPAGVPANRGGHGIRPQMVIDELAASGLQPDGSRQAWPSEQVKPGDERSFLVLFHKPAS